MDARDAGASEIDCREVRDGVRQMAVGECAISGISTTHVRELEAQLGTNHTLRNVLRSITQRVRDQIPGFPLARIAIAVRRAANPINPDVYTAERIQRSSQLIHALQQGLKLISMRSARMSALVCY